jgi:predicted metal-binding protein
MKRDSAQYKPFLKRIVGLGAIADKVIEPSAVVTADWVRMKCQFGCDGYGSSLRCLPHSPTPGQTRRTLDGYQAAILVHFGANEEVTKSMTAIEREVFLQGYHKALGLGAGPCNLCKFCPEDGCKHADKARPSMEACGIDVFSTARNNGYPIEVVVDESSEQNYYGLPLIE